MFYVCCSRPRKRLAILVTVEINAQFETYLRNVFGADNVVPYSEFISVAFPQNKNVAATFQPRPIYTGSAVGVPHYRGFSLKRENIDFNRPFQKIATPKGVAIFWLPGRFYMLGRSESALRQGFRLRRKRLYGAKAPPARRPELPGCKYPD